LLHATDAQFTQEFNLASEKSGFFSWMAGAFYMHDVVRYNNGGFSVFGNLSAIPGGEVTNPLFAIESTQPLNSYSAFAETYFQFNDATELTLGLRDTSDHRSITGVENFNPFFAAISGLPFTQIQYPRESRTDSGLTWRAVLDYKITSDNLVYASVNRGFKSGSYNNGQPGAAPVLPEKITAYELGLKSEFLDGRVRLNLAGYHYDYSELQQLVVVELTPTLVNAAAAKINGFEIGGEGSVTRDFVVTFGANYLRAKFSSFPDALLTTPNPSGGNNVTTGDATGNTLENSPKFTENIGARYSWDLADGKIDASLNYFHTSMFYWEPDNRLQQPAYGLLNGQMMWTNPDKRWSVRIWGKNLTNKQYYVFGTSESEGDSGTPGAPRTYGIGATVKM
jgi:iron complex outermembrane receptor protein